MFNKWVVAKTQQGRWSRKMLGRLWFCTIELLSCQLLVYLHPAYLMSLLASYMKILNAQNSLGKMFSRHKDYSSTVDPSAALMY